MTHVTEQALEEAKQALRAEYVERLNIVLQELSVQVKEAHTKCAGITLEDVRTEVAAAHTPTSGLAAEDVEMMITTALNNLPTAPAPGLTTDEVEQMITDSLPAEVPLGVHREEVETMIAGVRTYDDEEIKGRLHRLHVHSNGLADRIGAPRMES